MIIGTSERTSVRYQSFLGVDHLMLIEILFVGKEAQHAMSLILHVVVQSVALGLPVSFCF